MHEDQPSYEDDYQRNPEDLVVEPRIVEKRTVEEYEVELKAASGWDMNLKPREAKVMIRFVNGSFEGCHFNFTGMYDRRRWKCLAALSDLIEDIAGAHRDPPGSAEPPQVPGRRKIA